MLFLLEALGPTRADQFKRTHLGFKMSQNHLSPFRKTFQDDQNSFLSAKSKKKGATMLGSRTSYEKNSYTMTNDMLSQGELFLMNKKNAKK